MSPRLKNNKESNTNLLFANATEERCVGRGKYDIWSAVRNELYVGRALRSELAYLSFVRGRA